MRIIDKKAKYALEDQVIAKMFREDKRFRTRVIPNKKKEYKNESIKDIRKHKFGGLQFEPWET